MKSIIVILLIFIPLISEAQFDSTKTVTQLTENQKASQVNLPQVIDSVINYGKTLLGRKYRYGGLTPAGFDCSGYLKYIFKKYGITLPHSSREYATVGRKLPKDSIVNVHPGDILVFKGRNSKSKRIGHVAIVIENNNNQILMMHSCCDKGVAIENYLEAPYYLKRLVGIRRLSGHI
jgi:Cell wall-associated hydrolases (invasion-associated proteins)